MKFLKVGRVAIITRGRYAGKKVVIVQPVDNGNKPHPFGHAVVAGIERYPSKVTRRMSKSRQEKRSKIKPFIKVINYNHLMPTRYTLELEGLKGAISADTFKEVSQREDAKKNVKKVLEDRYTSGKNRWFFTPLRTFQSPQRRMSSMSYGKASTKRVSEEVFAASFGAIVADNLWHPSTCLSPRVKDVFEFA
ncbi:hypothetical protein E4U30_005903 [Claviceps sp. LM220 group G6]|nr:hypothetical protein E4U32_003740 [Claviceps aff. humidiphila group G2b]KAG6078976.1 hypothetical protein E4U15_004014 [Claviceps sp. LM218 group G6]KAG6092082.1 hypothetical protein E4U30_005903 [Claviceps sp. LM220 group G6]KAG6099386.1 hypothetical protein E4U14_007305 [Claviceps sp. LM454 group G7]KAG6104667.1 hypothetical protein E4U31_001868 [Claviceps sp. LM219 group G6]